ncbi:MAG: hypothetical protein JRI68_24475 [Deltaproteobacteria bacterium]|nr:hypothetical protein [Deltaproteobacteria bacterium]
MPHLRLHLALALIGALTLTGCSDEPTVTADEFITEYTQTYCKYLIRCCASSERSYGSTSQCEAAVKGQVNELLDFRVAAGARAAFNAGGAQACLDQIGGACNTSLAAGCMLDAVTPGQSEGQDCTYSAECQSFYCVQPKKHTKGSCGGSGTGCSGLDISCSSGAYCDSSRQCLVKKIDGDACSRPQECSSGICSPSFKQCGSTPQNLCDGQ